VSDYAGEKGKGGGEGSPKKPNGESNMGTLDGPKCYISRRQQKANLAPNSETGKKGKEEGTLLRKDRES